MRKKRALARAAALAVLLVMIVTMLSACGSSGNPVKVTVNDNGKTYAAEGMSNMTVEQLLNNAGITLEDKDQVFPEREVRWSESGEHLITVKRYAKVKVVFEDTQKEVEYVGGTVGMAIAQAGYDSADYKSDIDKTQYLTDGMVITLSRYRDGFVEENGRKYFYKDGQRQTDTIIGNDFDGYFYVNSSGVIDENYCDGVNIDGEDWNVIRGVAEKVVDEHSATLNRALKAVAKCTDTGMTMEEKLRASFDYIRTSYLEGVPHDPPYREADWPIVCANDIFVNGKGDCYSYGAAFAFMAKAIGYEEVYACNSGGHGWSEVEGLVYDPEWSMHSKKDTYFGVSYDDDTDVPYKFAISDGAEWKRKKI